VLTKTTPKIDVIRGELVPYTITVKNTQTLRLQDIKLIDQIPAGFQYRVGSATFDGVPREPLVSGRTLTWSNVVFKPSQTFTIKVLLVVGSGVGEGEFVNQVWASNGFTNTVISNVAKATVRIVPDPTFDCSDIIGKVFDDANRSGYPDDSERGIANVRLATARGLLVTTDSEGRFHIACADVPDSDRGTNFILKIDERTLPTGYRVTTENPRVVRLTRGKMTKLNFGAAISRVVRVDLMAEAFEPQGVHLQPRWAAAFPQVFGQIEDDKSILRIGYQRAPGEDRALSDQRMQHLVEAVRTQWGELGHAGKLTIETEFTSHPHAGSAGGPAPAGWTANKTPPQARSAGPFK
jgi:large repetitive protein